MRTEEEIRERIKEMDAFRESYLNEIREVRYFSGDTGERVARGQAFIYERIIANLEWVIDDEEVKPSSS